MSRGGWIGVDLDGTLAQYDGWKGAHHIGELIPEMAVRVRRWLAEGQEVRIFTARATYPEEVKYVRRYIKQHFGVDLKITNVKDPDMIELWDDRAVRVVANEGRPCCEHHRVKPEH